jgi:hypothetical protein
VCASNAECTRCTGDATIVCDSNSDCTGNGACSEAPDQPVTCGYWCNCGFCDDNPSLPCFENADCPDGQQCESGSGDAGANDAQEKPNDCSQDNFVCGQFDDELCAITTVGKCELQPYRNCTDDTICLNNDAGSCLIDSRPCFESRITRTGTPSPLGEYCAFENKTCSSNADCSQAGDFCAPDSARPQTVALFCIPATSNTAVNNAGGITGPGAVRLSSFIQVCRCGDSQVGCDEQCDDGNADGGDGCDENCQDE